MNGPDEFDEKELQELHEKAQSLPRDIAPNPAAWAAIRDRIEQTRVRELVPTANAEVNTASVNAELEESTRAFRPSHSWMRSTRGAALIAATLFIAVTTVVVQRQGAIDTERPDSLAANSARDDLAGVFARYDGAATDLQNDLERRRPQLNAAMVAVLDSCLSTLDEAIHETQSALKDAPDNATIAGLLEVTYQQKLDLLRRASELSESF